MLTIHPQTSAADVKKYFDTADYYSEGQETVGQWGGKLAGRLGLSGTVTKDAFDRLCDNLHPQTGKPLTPRTNDERRVGYDFTFSGPKSFSIARRPGRDGGTAAACGRRSTTSVDETMARGRGRHDDAGAERRRIPRPADRQHGWAASALHARPVDFKGSWPGWRQRHARLAAAANAHPARHAGAYPRLRLQRDARTRRKAASRPGSSRDIKRDGEYYTAVFYSKLAGRLEAMGYRHRPPRRQGMGDRRHPAVDDRQVQQAVATRSRPSTAGGCGTIPTTGRSTSTSWPRRRGRGSRRS